MCYDSSIWERPIVVPGNRPFWITGKLMLADKSREELRHPRDWTEKKRQKLSQKGLLDN